MVADIMRILLLSWLSLNLVLAMLSHASAQYSAAEYTNLMVPMPSRWIHRCLRHAKCFWAHNRRKCLAYFRDFDHLFKLMTR